MAPLYKQPTQGLSKISQTIRQRIVAHVRSMAYAINQKVIELLALITNLKQQVKENLQSEQGIAHRKKRCYDTEPIWGNIKSNHGFKRFMLRGLKKVTVEVGLLSLSQNVPYKIA